MNFACIIRTSYAPNAFSGADVMCERINTWLAAKGHKVRVAVDRLKEPYEYKGVKVEKSSLSSEIYKWADVIITHLVDRSEVVRQAKQHGKPVFHVCHNARNSTIPNDLKGNYMVYNSHNMQQNSPVRLPGIVVTPPTWAKEWVFADHYAQPYHTLVNCEENKGPRKQQQMAINLPRLQFLGIHGGYGQQLQFPRENLRYWKFTRDMQAVYDQTRVLLVPSDNESWSLCAAEAQACGIPVVCSDLPGLRENMGNTAIYCVNQRNYIDALVRLQNPIEYAERAAAGRERALAKNHEGELQEMLNFMQNVAG